MNILVTGGAGYIGSHTVLELLAAGHQPVVIDNFNNSSPAVLERLSEISGQDVAWYEQDFQDGKALRAVVDKHRIEAVIHFAALKAVNESVADPLAYYKNNTAGFVSLLQSLAGSSAQTVIFSSTAAVYGNPETDVITEDIACNPESPYGSSKYMDEIILSDTCKASDTLKGTALRYFNVVGAHESGRLGESPKNKPQNLLPIIVQATAGLTPPLTVMGSDYPTADGTCLRDYIHVTDLAKAHVAALEHATSQRAGGSFEVYNVGTGKPTSVLELIKAFESVNQVQVPHTLGPRRAGDPVISFATTTKINRELGWEAEKSVEDACRDAWRWHQQNPHGFDGTPSTAVGGAA